MQRNAVGPVTVFYDGLCPLCRRTVRYLQRLDRRHVLAFHDFRSVPLPGPLQSRMGYPDLLREMHVYLPRDDRVLRGFPAVRVLARAVPVLWPLLPVLYLPGMAYLGPVLYRWLARNRFRLTGCSDPTCPAVAARSTDPGATRA